MVRYILVPVLTALSAAALAQTALAQTGDHAPAQLRSAGELRQDAPRRESWTYFKPGLDLGRYRNLMIDPTTVYTGPDAQFDEIDADDRLRYAGFLTDELRSKLPSVMPLVGRAGPGTLRLKLTLIGMEPTTGGVATATRVTPMGFATNVLRSATGREGRFTGSMLVALEVHDAASGELLAAAIRRRSPDALDIPATLSTSDTARAVARDLAERIRDQLRDRRRGRN